MPRIEIRYDEKIYKPLLLIGAVGSVAGIFCFLATEGEKAPLLLKIGVISIMLFALYGVIRTAIKLGKREPVLTFSDEELCLHDIGRPVYIRWEELVSWKMTQDNDNGAWRLTVTTHQTNHGIGISGLDRTPEEIDLLLKRFSGRL